jgi:glycosyltransferase involved in cell wall biosynthesis
MNPTAPPQRGEPRMLWIGLPAYNEEATIAALFARFLEVFPGKSLPYRIVLYNDGCSDGTVTAARGLCPA